VLSTAHVHEIFKKSGIAEMVKGSWIADDVDWIVEGTHPLAGHHHSKAEFK
jgi:hypothetical protein